MRIVKSVFFSILFTLFTCFTYAQDTTAAVKWNMAVVQQKNNEYQIKLEGQIKDHWHLYQSDETEGLNGITISCDDTGVQISPLTTLSPFKKIQDPIFDGHSKWVIENKIDATIILSVPKGLSIITLKIGYEVANAETFFPEEQKIKVALNGKIATASYTKILVPTIDIENPASNCGALQNSSSVAPSKGLWHLFLMGFLGGLVALLTPCVFPMIPLTVSFFTKKAVSKKAGISNAFLYAFFIFFIYILLSLPFHFLDSINPEFLNNVSTNVYLNVLFFVVFIVFALSFFGLFEITLPSRFSTSADSKAGSGNILGIFFMALTLALVSFSCTGPILGSLLAGSLVSDGGAMQLTVGMGGFGLALALPFGLFAMFPHWLQSLPKSGGWLNTVKVTLGFLELALAFKFLSNADLVMHWGLLKREVFIFIWIIIGIGLSLYLFNLISFKHDSPSEKLSAGRKTLAYVVSLFTLYLIPGVTNTSWANLKLISGFPPPLYYSVYEKENDCVLGLHCTRDYAEALQMSKMEKKPILIDFTGYACVNCRRMEENVWSDPEVYKCMQDNFIVLSLYVDDKKKLSSEKQFIYTTKDGVKKEINTVGDQWATFETENFANNAQPLYAVIHSDEYLLNHPVGYTPNKKEYLEWLQCALTTYKNNSGIK